MWAALADLTAPFLVVDLGEGRHQQGKYSLPLPTACLLPAWGGLPPSMEPPLCSTTVPFTSSQALGQTWLPPALVVALFC